MTNGKAKCRDSWSHPKSLRNEETKSSSFHWEDGCVHSAEIITSKDEAGATDVGNPKQSEEWETGFVNFVEI